MHNPNIDLNTHGIITASDTDTVTDTHSNAHADTHTHTDERMNKRSLRIGVGELEGW